MTNEEIFDLAKQAGFHYPSNDCLLVPFAKLVAEAERKRCLNILLQMHKDALRSHSYYLHAAVQIDTKETK